MRMNRIRAVAASAMVSALVGGALVALSPSAGAAGGTLTLDPSSGDGSTLLSVTTSGGCADAKATHFTVSLSGTGIKQVVPTIPETYETTAYMVGMTGLGAIGASGVGTTAMHVALSKMFGTVAAANKAATIPNGTYTLAFECREGPGSATPVATFTTAVTILTTASGLTFSQGTPSTALPNTKKPVISGKATVGSKLTVSKGTWASKPSKVTFQWKRGSKVVGTASSYTPVGKDRNKKLTVTVTATAAGYLPGKVTVSTATIK